MPAPVVLAGRLSWRSAKRFAATRFLNAGLSFADDDALDIVLALGRMSRAAYAARGRDAMPEAVQERFRRAVERRLAGVPVDRILGKREFFGRDFAVDGVLSPRGDTEVLLLAAMEAVSDTLRPRVLELGTGSGALAITLLAERADTTAAATDLSDTALDVARANAAAHGVEDRLSLHHADWFAGLPQERFDAVISNPPYITDAAMEALPAEVADHDPALALRGGADGLDAYRAIVPDARDWLRPRGWLGVEIGHDQGAAVSELFEACGYASVQTLQDPAGLDRVVCGRVGAGVQGAQETL